MEHLQNWKHHHSFHPQSEKSEKRTWIVIILTVVTMVVEIVSGSIFNSMALLADGWHMSTHAAALSITVFAYYYARKYADDGRFSFGTGKVGVLGGFASAVALGVVALVMILESVERLVEPQAIYFNQAILVAVVGLVVNLLSAVILKDGHHDHQGSRGHHGHGHHVDHNLRAAYLHVLADALTSLLAIVALSIGKYTGWIWLDPVMGIVGACVIFRWAYLLVMDTSNILIDCMPEESVTSKIKEALEEEGKDIISDLHVWQVSPNHVAAVISLVVNDVKDPKHYKGLLSSIVGLDHVTVEVNAA